ncbi:MAG TPA: glycosyltransferase, partial [Longimicrobiaceae bacterium]|nr:glycosyltransferase [Longimicrobiaceae bacterium]
MSAAAERVLREPHIAVVLPCYNEERHLAGVLAALPEMVRTIVVVDDGSTDGTAELLGRVTDPRLVTIRHPRNEGVGAAMASGYRAALEQGAEICVKMDGDGQMSAEHLPTLIAPLLRREADYSKGNRFRDLEALARMPRLRLIGNGVLSFLTKLVSGYWTVFDPTNGYTAIHGSVLRRLNVARLDRRYFFETSMLIELNIHGAVVRDVEIPARYADETSSLRVWAEVLRFPPLLVRGFARRFFWRYMIRDFNVLTLCVLAAVPLLLFGVLFGGYHWWLSTATGIPATAGTTILAALPIILGFQCLLSAVMLDMLYQPARPLLRASRSGVPRWWGGERGRGSLDLDVVEEVARGRQLRAGAGDEERDGDHQVATEGHEPAGDEADHEAPEAADERARPGDRVP